MYTQISRENLIKKNAQRRPIAGDRHFILADPEKPDEWALPGTCQVVGTLNGVRLFSRPKTISTDNLKAWAKQTNRRFMIMDDCSLVRTE